MTLLDTHVVLWLLDDADHLGPRTRDLLATAPSVQVSTVSLWEIAIKSRLGRLSVPHDLPRRIESAGLRWLPLTAEHAWAARGPIDLPHQDPFDRQLVAQVLVEALPLVTADRALLAAEVLGLRVLDARA